MPSVSPELYRTISWVSRYLFAITALLILLRTVLRMLSDARERKAQLRNLPGSGLIGEMVVISGNDELPEGTYLPVPREGVLGFVRSCDLVVPVDGVRRVHLDFTWRDGTGLLISPRSGCTAVVNSALLDHRSPPDSVPMTHGAFLQVGSAVLRLRVYAALDNTGSEFTFRDSPQALQQASRMPPPAQTPYPPAYPGQPEYTPPGPQDYPPAPAEYQPAPPSQEYPPVPTPPEYAVPRPPVPEGAEPAPAPDAEATPPRRPNDRWKEDWSE